MPELARFFGIVIRMFAETGAQHSRPHFHAYYQGDAAVYTIGPVELLAGTLPIRQRRLVEAWAEIHLDELLNDWERLQAGVPPLKIDPLR